MMFSIRLKLSVSVVLFTLSSLVVSAEPETHPEIEMQQVEVAETAGTTNEPAAVVNAVSDAEASPAAVQLPVDLKKAADIAIEAYGGEVLKADEIADNSGTQFQIRLVNEGRVKDVVIDAANGEIVSPEEEQ